MGIKTVAVHSDVDSDSMHVRLADESVCIGSHQPQNSYLNISSIMSAVDLTGAEAVHPGYGFLSENAKFSEIVNKHGIKFIGPSAKIISMMAETSKEVEKERQIAENMKALAEMQKNREELMASKIAKLTRWRLINVIQFVEILKKEFGEDISKIEDQTCALCCCDLYEGI